MNEGSTAANDASPEEKTYPGLRRLAYFFSALGLLVLMGVGIGMLSATAPESALPASIFLVFFAAAILYVVSLRYRNQGASAWWALGIFVPVFNLYVSVRALAYPEGYADHRKFDTAAIVIIVLSILAFVLQILFVIALPAYHEYIEAAEAARQQG